MAIPVEAQGGVHNLNTGLEYASIQAAIDAPETLGGHTIEVSSGVYSESIEITKSIILKGIGLPTLKPTSPDHVVFFGADDVTFDGFHIDGEGITNVQNDWIMGIMTAGTSGANIINNVIERCYIAIEPQGSYHYIAANVTRNILWNDVWAEHTNNVTIDGNIFLSQPGGRSICLSSSSGCTITHNTMTARFDFYETSNMLVYHNNILDGAIDGTSGSNTNWDDGYPSGGNYWRYRIEDGTRYAYWTSPDDFSGPDQDQPGSDGIVDKPFNVEGGGRQDRYPLVQPVTPASYSATTASGSNVAIDLGVALIEFSRVTNEGSTAMTPLLTNTLGNIPAGYENALFFVDLTTAATYSSPIVVGLHYVQPLLMPEGSLRLFHQTGSGWQDVTTRIDTTKHIVYGQVNSLSWFFIGGQWVWIEEGQGVPAFPSLYIGIGAAFAAGILAYFLRRKVAAG
jgi:parallel beta-helix repeat protein